MRICVYMLTNPVIILFMLSIIRNFVCFCRFDKSCFILEKENFIENLDIVLLNIFLFKTVSIYVVNLFNDAHLKIVT